MKTDIDWPAHFREAMQKRGEDPAAWVISGVISFDGGRRSDGREWGFVEARIDYRAAGASSITTPTRHIFLRDYTESDHA
jgi:hypothetical protein